VALNRVAFCATACRAASSGSCDCVATVGKIGWWTWCCSPIDSRQCTRRMSNRHAEAWARRRPRSEKSLEGHKRTPCAETSAHTSPVS